MLFKSNNLLFDQIHNITKNSYLFLLEESKSFLDRDICEEEIKCDVF